MSDELKTQIAELRAKILSSCDEFGEEAVQLIQQESLMLLHWLRYIIDSQRTGVANSLIEGVICSLKEAAACAAIGFVRPALFAMRAQIDLALGWLYFKDHPVEWKTVNERANHFKLKKDILEYLSIHYPGFDVRFRLLTEVKTRQSDDPYRLLSAHVHAQSALVLPQADSLSDVVKAKALTLECPALVKETSEYLSDILISVYADKWAAIPESVQQNIQSRLEQKKGHLERFFQGK